MVYRRRILDDELDELFAELPALAIDGAKAVGKTTTAVEHVEGLLFLDSRANLVPISADPELLLRRHRPLLIDEWQRVPEVWDVVRRAVDDDPRAGQFLLAGSASPERGATAHSGAGRIGRLRMRPMTLAERVDLDETVSLRDLLRGTRPELGGTTSWTLGDYVEEIVASGFPGMRTLSPRALRFQLDSYVRNAVDRDLPELGIAVRRPEVLLAWVRAYAAATSTSASYNAILDAATPGQGDKPARETGAAYRDALTQLWLLDPVPAWQPGGSALTRLGRAPKHHMVDPAVAARVLGLGVDTLLDGEGATLGGAPGSMLGHLFESLVTLCVRVPAQAAESSVGHLRTRNGDHEVDLVVERGDGKVVAIEVKLARTIEDRDVRHLHWLRDRLGDRLLDAVVVTTGPEAYRRPDGVGVVPLALLGA